jgi:hypothetical protein
VAAELGAHYDKSITTGVQAYNYGLAYIAEAAGDGMFVDLSISPIFPGGQYAHARRVSCDVFGGIFNSEYLMNNAGSSSRRSRRMAISSTPSTRLARG